MILSRMIFRTKHERPCLEAVGVNKNAGRVISHSVQLQWPVSTPGEYMTACCSLIILNLLSFSLEKILYFHHSIAFSYNCHFRDKPYNFCQNQKHNHILSFQRKKTHGHFLSFLKVKVYKNNSYNLSQVRNYHFGLSF